LVIRLIISLITGIKIASEEVLADAKVSSGTYDSSRNGSVDSAEDSLVSHDLSGPR
jgi:hypothetical protein